MGYASEIEANTCRYLIITFSKVKYGERNSDDERKLCFQ